MSNARVIKNNKAYDSGDVKVFINGVPIRCTEITYKNKQEHQLNYTLGNEATSWSAGKIEPEASVGLMMQDAIQLENAAPNRNLLKLKPFDINVTFFNEYNKVVNDTIVAKFQDQGREVNGEMGLQSNYELFAMSIEPNNV